MKDMNSKIQRLKIKGLFFFKIDIFTKDSGKIHKEMEKVSKSGRMALFMRDIGKITKLMALED